MEREMEVVGEAVAGISNGKGVAKSSTLYGRGNGGSGGSGQLHQQ